MFKHIFLTLHKNTCWSTWPLKYRIFRRPMVNVIFNWFQWYNLLDDLDCRMMVSTDQYHDYYLLMNWNYLKSCVIYFTLNYDNKWSLKVSYYNSVPKFFKAYVLLLAHLSQRLILYMVRL